MYKLPINYNKTPFSERRLIREQYVKQQNNLCYYCNCDLSIRPPEHITNKTIDWKRFPPNFLQHPIHLQHCHKTGMTEGAVHSYCNAVMWQYDGR